MTALGKVRLRIFGIPQPRKVFNRKGFAPGGWDHFGPVITSLALGYNATLEDSSVPALVRSLESVDPALLGFAYEGAAMGLGVLDVIAPWKKRLDALLEGPGSQHMATVYVGLGLTLARLRRKPEQYLAGLDPVLGWAVVDGYGFHEGFFARRRSIVKQVRPTHLSDHGRTLYDQGLGRSIWFASGADVGRAATTISNFEPSRRADLWTGTATACSFAGGTDRAGLDQLLDLASDYRHRLAWAAATAAWTRDLAGNQTPHTDLACEVLCQHPSSTAAQILEQARRDLVGTPRATSYQTWRRTCTAALAVPVAGRKT